MDIPNPRLTNQNIKTMMFSFTPCHVPGKKNVVADCLSRRSDSPIPPVTRKSQNLLDTSNILPGYEDNLGPPSWVHCTGGDGPPEHGHQGALQLHPTEQELHETDQVELLLFGLGMAAIAEIYDEDDCLRLAAAKLTTLARPNPGDQPVLLTWARLEKAALNCKPYQTLHSLVSNGAQDDKTAWPELLLPY